VVTPAGARYFLYAVAVARIGRLLTGTARRLLDAVTGVVLVALGVRLAADAR
jgi:threonine/homoserine/homoserine lactone efflux protein